MKEIVVISGKGGTGKTSLVSSFASFAKNCVFADCDVDAADLHLILSPEKIKTSPFISGKEAFINEKECCDCRICIENCRFDAVFINKNNKAEIDPSSCEGCGVCVRFCPQKAISFEQRLCGSWFISNTRFGKMVHAKLLAAGENSGKLVSLVRDEAKKIAQKNNNDLVLIDGPPGVGCPVIASVTGVDGVVIVTEPTVSGLHDLQRVASLTKHFGIKTFVCINKFDLNKNQAKKIEKFCDKENIICLGHISYNENITKAQNCKKSIVEYEEGQTSLEIKNIWKLLCEKI